MKAALLIAKDDQLGYEVQEIEQPKPAKNQVLVKTKAFSLNPIDLKTLRGNRFSPKLLEQKPSILGWDGAGIIEQTGEDVQDFQKGDKVMGMINFPDFGRTFADYFLAKPEDLVEIPSNFSFVKAAALPLAGLTAFQAIKYHCKPGNEKRLLIHAGGGGVGHLGIQIAKKIGFYVITTASESKRDFVLECGADEVINYRESVFDEVINEPVDAVFDLIGGNYIDQSLRILKKDGVLVSIPSSANEDVEEKAKAKSRTGVRFKVKADQKDLQEITNLFQSESDRIFVSESFSWEEISRAFAMLEEGHVKGKMVVSI